MMKEIKLTQGKIALVDDEDFKLFGHLKWRALKGRTGIWYAGREANGTTEYLHRVIMGSPPGILIDHENKDGLNCQKYNLRKSTKSQNGANRRSARTSTSRYLGVSWCKVSKKWTTQMTVKKKPIRVGRYHSETEAAKAYNIAAVKHHGKFARLNIV